MIPYLSTVLSYSLYSQKKRKRKRKVKSFSHVWLFVTPWTVAYQASLSMGFSRQEYWSGLPFASPGDLPHPGVKPRSPALQADALPSEPPGKPLQPKITMNCFAQWARCFYYPTCGQVTAKPSPVLVKFPVPWFLSPLLLVCPFYHSNYSSSVFWRLSSSA